MTRHSKRGGARPDDARFPVPDEVEALVRKLMAKRPDDRFKTAAQAAEAIACIRAHQEGESMAPRVTGWYVLRPLVCR